MCLKENGPMKQTFFSKITHLVRYWSKNRHNEDYKSYSILMQQFWSELDKLFNLLIDAGQHSETFNIVDTNNAQIEFLITLKTAPAHGRKNLKVKFSNSEEDEIIQPQTEIISTDIDTQFISELNNFVNSLCIKYFNQITKECEKKYIVHLNKLIICFESEDLFKNLSESLKTQINFSNFYEQILRNWLLEPSKETEHIVELIFNFMKYMNDSEKNEILKSLTQVKYIFLCKYVQLNDIYIYIYSISV